MLQNPCKTLGFKKIAPGWRETISSQWPTFCGTGLISTAKTSVHSNQDQHSVTTITDHIEQKKGKQYKIAY